MSSFFIPETEKAMKESHFFRPLGTNEAYPTLAFDALCITRKRFGTQLTSRICRSRTRVD